MVTTISGLTADRMLAIESLVQAAGILDTVQDVQQSAQDAANSAQDAASSAASTAADVVTVNGIESNINDAVASAVMKTYDVGTSADLNSTTFTTTSGLWSVTTTAQATASLNLPVNKPGIIEVYIANGITPPTILQRYTLQDGTGIYVRSSTNGTSWTSWKLYAPKDTTIGTSVRMTNTSTANIPSASTTPAPGAWTVIADSVPVTNFFTSLPSTGVLTFSVAGTYGIYVDVSFQNNSDGSANGSRRAVILSKNTGEIARADVIVNTAAARNTESLYITYNFAVNDTLTLSLYQTAANAVPLFGTQGMRWDVTKLA